MLIKEKKKVTRKSTFFRKIQYGTNKPGTRTRKPKLAEAVWRSDLDDKARENVIRVMDMRVALHDKRVTALVADGVEGLTFCDDIDFITRPVQEPVPSKSSLVIMRALSDRSEQD